MRGLMRPVQKGGNTMPNRINGVAFETTEEQEGKCDFCEERITAGQKQRRIFLGEKLLVIVHDFCAYDLYQSFAQGWWG